MKYLYVYYLSRLYECRYCAYPEELQYCIPQLLNPVVALLKQEKIGVLSSRSNRAKTLMSKAFGQRWHGMPYEETELYKELEEADKERYEKEACAQDTAASLS